MNMKKILFINSVCSTGSTGRIVLDLYYYLEKNGYNCCAAYGRKRVQDNIHTIKIGTFLGVCIHGLCSRVTDRHGFYSSYATRKLLDEIERYNPDVIHLHNVHGYYINIKILFEYLKEKGIPIIWTLHDCWAFTGHCAHFDGAGCHKWKTSCQDCQLKHSYPASFVLDGSEWNFRQKKALFTGLKNVTLVVPSVWLKNQVKESFLAGYDVRVIQNGIDLSIFYPRENKIREKYKIKEKVIILGAANRWSPNKGLGYFIELQKYLDNSYKIILVGLSKKQIKELPKGMLGLERTESIDEMAELYSAADLFFNASKEETMGLVTVEALACGTPVMAFNRTAIPETFDETCGILLQDERVECIAQIVKGKEWKKILPSACVKFAEKFAKEKKYEEYQKLVEMICKSKN